ncbi:hypothetical protein M422DRAFT_243727 [Sphaerobolus stellatus SS14]|nr:hypothetical protein M422DRAFT_243727 [Sphaerobolus stellatus SS14]
MPAATKRPHPLAAMGRSADAAPDPLPSQHRSGSPLETGFLTHYAPWLPAISLFVTAPPSLRRSLPFSAHNCFAYMAYTSPPHPLRRARNRIPLPNIDLRHSFPPYRLPRHPHHQASDETKASMWSWTVTGNKAAHRVFDLWNKFADVMSESRNNNTSSRAAAVEDKTQPHPLVISPPAPHHPPSLHPQHSPHVRIPKTRLALNPPKNRTSPSPRPDLRNGRRRRYAPPPTPSRSLQIWASPFNIQVAPRGVHKAG